MSDSRTKVVFRFFFLFFASVLPCCMHEKAVCRSSVCLSVSLQTRDMWQNERKLCPLLCLDMTRLAGCQTDSNIVNSISQYFVIGVAIATGRHRYTYSMHR